MPKVIAAFNMMLDAKCDHTTGTPDNEVHQHYTDLLNSGGTVLYGRTTYQLMEDFWPQLVKNPGDNKAYNDFALAIENIDKVLFSRTIKSVHWTNSRLATQDIQEEVKLLKQNSTRDIFVGSRSLIVQLLNLGLIDEFQLCIHPVIVGSGIKLFDNIDKQINLKLLRTKTFAASGVVLHCYQPIKK